MDLTSKEQTSEFPRKNQRKARESSGLRKQIIHVIQYIENLMSSSDSDTNSKFVDATRQ